MVDYYLYFKAFHIVFFTSWFAGLFYLPRIYVNLAMVSETATYQHLILMATKLYRFVTPIMFTTVILGGILLYLNPGLIKTGWMQIKILLIILLIGYHFLCGFYLKKFTLNQSTKNHVYYRLFNEFPVIILVLVVILAVTKSI